MDYQAILAFKDFLHKDNDLEFQSALKEKPDTTREENIAWDVFALYYRSGSEVDYLELDLETSFIPSECKKYCYIRDDTVTGLRMMLAFDDILFLTTNYRGLQKS